MIENGKDVKLCEIIQLLVEFIMSLGVKECKPSTKKRIRRDKEPQFNGLLNFENLLNSTRVFPIPASLTPVQIARNMVTIITEENESRSATTD